MICLYFVKGMGLVCVTLYLCVSEEVIIECVCWIQVNREVGGDSWCVMEERYASVLF